MTTSFLAQSGELSGTVVDPNGFVLPGVTVDAVLRFDTNRDCELTVTDGTPAAVMTFTAWHQRRSADALSR